ncbi:MAG: hypothetical protein E4H03_14025, partial [Myxococcales bacterium]
MPAAEWRATCVPTDGARSTPERTPWRLPLGGAGHAVGSVCRSRCGPALAATGARLCSQSSRGVAPVRGRAEVWGDAVMASNPCRSAVSVFGRLFAGRKPCHACSDVSPESRSVPKRTAPGLAAILVAVVVLGASGCERGAPGPLCPGCNVVLVSMDTLRSDHLGAYGYDRPVTPAIDRLAARSVVFADAIGQSSWTRPAHFSMFTGLYPSEHGVVA